MSYADDDLFDSAPVSSPLDYRGVPKSGESDLRRRATIATLKRTNSHIVRSGVSVSWLMDVFGMTKAQVAKALRDCKPVGTHQNGGLLYHLPDAASYLVKPKAQLAEFIANIKPEQLPQKLQEGFWNAKLKEQRYRVIAGELWPTERVLDVFSDTFQSFKNTTNLWLDTVNETNGLSEQQRATLARLVDQLQDDMHTRLLLQASEKATPSQVADLDDA